MKKQILTLGMMCAAAFALTNCDKQSTEPQQPTEGTPFEIIASAVDTKTTNDGLHTNWAEGDALNLFHAEAGSTVYGSNDKFTWTGEGNKFSGTLTENLETGKSYDWYAVYPVNTNEKYIITTPAGSEDGDGFTYIGHSKGAYQQGNNSTAHLKETLCPLYGVAKGVDANSSVNIAMHHLASVVKIVVKNSNDAPLTVSSIEFTAPEDIVGSYFIDITKSPVTYTKSADNYVKNVATLEVKDGTPIAKGESAEFYIPIKPFTAASGSTLKISVNGYEKPLEMTKDVIFNAGEIKAVSFNYDKTTTPDPEPSDYATTYTSNVSWSAGNDKTYDATVKIGDAEYKAIKAGTGKKAGNIKLTIPTGTRKLHIHAVGWNGKNVILKISGASVSENQITLKNDSGFSDITADTELTLEGAKGDDFRVLLFGVNAE